MKSQKNSVEIMRILKPHSDNFSSPFHRFLNSTLRSIHEWNIKNIDGIMEPINQFLGLLINQLKKFVHIFINFFYSSRSGNSEQLKKIVHQFKSGVDSLKELRRQQPGVVRLLFEIMFIIKNCDWLTLSTVLRLDLRSFIGTLAYGTSDFRHTSSVHDINERISRTGNTFAHTV